MRNTVPNTEKNILIATIKPKNMPIVPMLTIQNCISASFSL